MQLSNTYIFHFNLSKTYSTVQTMEYNRQLLVSNGSTGTVVHYSTPGQLQSTNNIIKTYDNYSHRQSNLSRGTVHQTMNSNKESSDAPRLLMNGTPKTHSITKVIDDHPYRPYFTKETFGTLTLNQKEARKQLTGQLYTGNNDNIMNNILRMEKGANTVVSPYFLPSPNQLNKIKGNLKKDATALEEVTQLYNTLSEPGPLRKEATLSELTRLQFGVLRIKERNKDYTHVEAATVRHISSVLHQIAASIKKEITSALKIQIYKYFRSIMQFVQFPHYGGKDMAFLLERSQTYDCIKKVSRKSDMVQSLLKECAVTVKHKFEVRLSF